MQSHKGKPINKIILVTETDTATLYTKSEKILITQPITAEKIMTALNVETQKLFKKIYLRLTKSEIEKWVKNPQPYIVTVADKDCPGITYRWRIIREKDLPKLSKAIESEN